MTDQLPENPFSKGVSGKYILQITSVTRHRSKYGYILSDAVGRKYNATSINRYAEGQFLRCIVFFNIASKHLSVSATHICVDQDLATPIPESDKVSIGASFQNACNKLSPKKLQKKKTIPDRQQDIPKAKEKRFPFRNGAPSTLQQTGEYYLIVVRMSWYEGNSYKFLYVLIDDRGQEYHAVSVKEHYIGKTMLCDVEVLKEKTGYLYFVSLAQDESSKPICEIDGNIVPRHHYTYSSTPTKQPHSHKAEKDSKERQKKQPDLIQVNGINYLKGGRYKFTVSSLYDNQRNRILEDDYGHKHLLMGPGTRFSEGDRITCSVRGFSKDFMPYISGEYLILSDPKVPNKVRVKVTNISSSGKWQSKVQDLGRHKCGKPFRCSCCGKDFPANAGWRVDLKEIYFCNSCAKKIYLPKGRGNHHFYISTPMGNKR